VLYAFHGGSDGAWPYGGLIADDAGNLYGTTYEGGAACSESGGCGTVFKLAPDGTETVLYAFQNGSDGAFPSAGLIADQSGNLYGTTSQGGHVQAKCGGSGCGTVFSVAPSGAETVLYSFQGGLDDGAEPLAGLFADQAGNLYGTTFLGSSKQCGREGCGAIFRLAPDGSERVMHAFVDSVGGRGPRGGLIAGKDGKLYGTAANGGANCKRCGIVFSIRP